MIVGSANVNDRSMNGDRDTEVSLICLQYSSVIFLQMAIRIEDTAHMNSLMNGKQWVVGIVPHMFRKRLMAKHVNDYTTGLRYLCN